MPLYCPVVVQLPITILSSAVRVVLPGPMEALKITGWLQALLSGTFTVTIEDDLGEQLASLTWSANGAQVSTIQKRIVNELRFNVSGIGVGASGCYITVWCNAWSPPSE